MTVQEFVARLDGGKQSGRGVIARCPAHDDRNPSLSVKEGERGLLVKCWIGCTAAEIVAAMGLTLCDLFYDAGLPRQFRPRLDRNQIAFQLRFHADKLFLRAQAVLDAAKNLDIDGWHDSQLDQAVAAVTKAYNDRERADLLDQVAFNVRCRVLAKKGTAHAV